MPVGDNAKVIGSVAMMWLWWWQSRYHRGGGKSTSGCPGGRSSGCGCGPEYFY